MFGFVGRRVAFLGLTATVMSVVIFVATRVLPGDAATQTLGIYVGWDRVQAVRQQMGLDQPAWQQYLHWIGGALHGDLGRSLAFSEPVSSQVRAAAGHSLLLAALTIVLAAVFGVGIGTLAGLRRGTWLDSAAVAISTLAVSVPEFLLPLLLILVFGVQLGWFPTFGWSGLDAGIGAAISHLVLPVVTLTLLALPHLIRVTRSSVIDSAASEHVRVAAARGLRRSTVVRRYVLRVALIPPVAVLAMDVGYLLSNVVIVETVFGFPGIGRLTVTAISYRDTPLIQACALLLVLAFGLGSLAGDLVTARLDPRVREAVAGSRRGRRAVAPVRAR
jgi:peptide/nickel transport system permease protein